MMHINWCERSFADIWIMYVHRRLWFIRLLHTIIWIFFNIVIGYMLYAVIANRLDTLLWVCYALVAAEGLILWLCGWQCPLTLLARRYSHSSKDNFDIFLPVWLAKYTKTIYTSLTMVILLLTLYRVLT
ncbi:hypothetical protein [Terrimonas ferruginea]|uniref:hypothetical protein n=1 Tax=Terrimonas ferruginea TaxID=249 RepID=UPI001B7F8E7F|nr:hypothetical protein [Terrimonas ferruginea]